MGLHRYIVQVTDDAEEDLNRYVSYLLVVKKNEQAARNVINDYEATVLRLESVAGSLKPDDDPKCRKLGYYRINFSRHAYFLLYRINGNTVIIDRMFHQLEDYRNKL